MPLAPACVALKVLVLNTFAALARLCCLCLRACRRLPAARVWLFQRPWGFGGKLGAPFQLRLSPVKQATQQCQPVFTAALANLPGIPLTVLRHQPLPLALGLGEGPAAPALLILQCPSLQWRRGELYQRC